MEEPFINNSSKEVPFDPEHDESAISLYDMERYEEVSVGDSVVLNEDGPNDVHWSVFAKDDAHYTLSVKRKTVEDVEDVKEAVPMKNIVDHKHHNNVAA